MFALLQATCSKRSDYDILQMDNTHIQLKRKTTE